MRCWVRQEPKDDLGKGAAEGKSEQSVEAAVGLEVKGSYSRGKGHQTLEGQGDDGSLDRGQDGVQVSRELDRIGPWKQ